MHTLCNAQCNNSIKPHPWFVTGLTNACAAGNGNFTLGFYKSNDYKMGYQIQGIFKITMHKKDYYLLQTVQDWFAVGKITKHGDTTLQYAVKPLVDLQRVILYFDNYPLLNEKKP